LRLQVGDAAGAAQDFQRTAEIDPGSAPARRDLGLARFIAGDYPGAQQELGLAVDRAQSSDLQLLLWRYLARIHAEPGQAESARSELSREAKQSKVDSWPRPLVARYLGEIDDDQATAAVSKSLEEATSEATRAQIRCEADYFLGELASAQGRAAAAAHSLEMAVSTCPPESFHAFAARARSARAATP
jgi:lipoprotein NlpI